MYEIPNPSSSFTYYSNPQQGEFTHMEPIDQISIESFSNGWLNTINPAVDFARLEDSLRRSFIEMDPDLFSMRWTDAAAFNFARFEPSNLVHADQIFCNGQLLPLSNLEKKDAFFTSDSALDRSRSADSSKTLLSQRICWDDSSVSTNTSPTHSSSYSNSGAMKLKLPLYRNRKSSAGKMLRKYLNFLIPLWKMAKKLKMMSLRTTLSCGDSPVSSMRMRHEFSSMEQSRENPVFNREFECSIHDAVLHCKKSVADSNAEA